MHLINSLTVLACLASSANSYMIRAWSEPDCTGEAVEVNVWDNTCRNTNVPTMKSFNVIAYGAGRQKATFWKNNFCSNSPPPMILGQWWADGGDNYFKKGACLKADSDLVPGAFGSHSA